MSRASSLVTRDSDPAGALATLAEQLRAEDSVITPHVVEPSAEPALGLLAAAGPKAAGEPASFALVVESVREGYLLHYGEPRLLTGHDPDLALLAGDYLYALGIERLAALGDPDPVRELGDLISLSAQFHAEERLELVSPLWLASMVAVGCGPSDAHEAAKSAARKLDEAASERLCEAARSGAAQAGLGSDLDHAADAIDFRIPKVPDLG